jgi:hypothetical protein
MSDYTLTLTQRQLETLMEALDVYSRLGIGQWRGAFECLPLRQKESGFDWSDWQGFLDTVGRELSQFTKHGVDGHRSSLGIYGSETPETAQIAWDLYQVVRHRLSWEWAVKQGKVPSLDSPRDWREMIGVNYDEPMLVSSQPLAKLDKAD